MKSMVKRWNPKNKKKDVQLINWSHVFWTSESTEITSFFQYKSLNISDVSYKNSLLWKSYVYIPVRGSVCLSVAVYPCKLIQLAICMYVCAMAMYTCGRARTICSVCSFRTLYNVFVCAPQMSLSVMDHRTPWHKHLLDMPRSLFRGSRFKTHQKDGQRGHLSNV